MKKAILLVVLLLTLPAYSHAGSDFSKQSNVVYGMYSGLALLMDVYQPEEANGIAVIWIHGSGWHAGMEMNTAALKDRSGVFQLLGHELLENGFTIFNINHRSAPRFQMPEILSDVQRAVRFIRHHAESYEVNPSKLVAFGGSSGAHLVSMLGVLDGTGDPNASDEILRHSAKVQCVVAHATPAHLLAEDTPHRFVSSITAAMGQRLPRTQDDKSAYENASPAHHVTSDDPPMLLIHGDADNIVPFSQSQLMKKTLKEAGVEVTLVRVPGGAHGTTGSFRNAEEGKLPHPKAVVDWILEHL